MDPGVRSRAWAALDLYFRDKPYFLTAHHIDLYDRFIHRDVIDIIRSMNPFPMVRTDAATGRAYAVDVYVGENRVSIDHPVVVDATDGSVRPMYPNEARLKDFTYAVNLYADVRVKVRVDDREPEDDVVFENVHIGMVPLMLHSSMCVLHGMSPGVLREMGECPNDRGGYFIVDGREKVIVTREARVTNRLYVRRSEETKKHLAYTAFIVCKSLDKNEVFPRTTTFHVRAPDAPSRASEILVTVTHISKEIPLFVLFRALGVESDREIMEHVVYDVNAPDEADVVEFLRASVLDAARAGVVDQRSAIKYLVPLMRFKTQVDLKNVLATDLFPNVGFAVKPKAMMLGYLVRRIVRTALGKTSVSELDDYTNKRLMPSGFLIGELFRDIYLKLRENCLRVLNAEFTSGAWRTSGDVRAIVNSINLRGMFPPRLVHDHFVRSMKGDWGAEENGDDEQSGIVQDLNRVSYLTYVSHVRRVNNPVDRSLKMADPHKLLASHWGTLCPVESPDGPNIGLLSHLAVLCSISNDSDPSALMGHLEAAGLATPAAGLATRLHDLRGATKVLVNDTWVAVTYDPPALCERVRALRRAGRIDRTVSVAWHILDGEVHLHTDRGRCCRPLCVVDEVSKTCALFEAQRELPRDWDALFGDRSSSVLPPSGQAPPRPSTPAMVELIDVEELRTRLVAPSVKDIVAHPAYKYTHCELHPTTILSAVTNTYPILNHNNAAYNVLCLAQFKQAIGTYATNFNSRMDTIGYVLTHPQRPLVSTDFADKLCHGTLAYGENAIVAIATYTGYNQGDSVILNRDAVGRGRFSMTYYNTEGFSESDPSSETKRVFGNPVRMEAEGRAVRGIRAASYDKLGADGYPLLDAHIEEDDVLMGFVETRPGESHDVASASSAPAAPSASYSDASVPAGRHRGGRKIDRVFAYERAGVRACKIRMRQLRSPELGDKMASRFGQKGVVGMLIPPEDMPFGSRTGLVPDVIINPNAFPKRMTVTHLLESILAKTASMRGARYNANNFEYPDVVSEASAALQSMGFDPSGDEIMYNGRTGEMIECKIFVGINYYGRLKHMVEDKYQHRTRGPINAIVRQPTKGSDGSSGGLRVGEMEQNALIAHGIASFVKESFMDRSDRYQMTVDPVDGSVWSDRRDEQREGRGAARIEVPYAFKLMQQELSSMGIQMRPTPVDDGDFRSDLLPPHAAGGEMDDDVGDVSDGVDVGDVGDDDGDVDHGDGDDS